MAKSNKVIDDELMKEIMAAGRGGDTIVAHITPEEAEILKARGGAGTINPKTGFLEFREGEQGGVSDGHGGAEAAGSGGGSTGGGGGGNSGGGSGGSSGSGGGHTAGTDGDTTPGAGNFGLGPSRGSDPSGADLDAQIGAGLSAGQQANAQAAENDAQHGGLGEGGIADAIMDALLPSIVDDISQFGLKGLAPTGTRMGILGMVPYVNTVQTVAKTMGSLIAALTGQEETVDNSVNDSSKSADDHGGDNLKDEIKSTTARVEKIGNSSGGTDPFDDFQDRLDKIFTGHAAPFQFSDEIEFEILNQPKPFRGGRK